MNRNEYLLLALTAAIAALNEERNIEKAGSAVLAAAELVPDRRRNSGKLTTEAWIARSTLAASCLSLNADILRKPVMA